MICIMVKVHHTATTTLPPTAAAYPHLAHTTRALHNFTALWILCHHAYDLLALPRGEDPVGVTKIARGLNHTVHKT